MLKRRIRTLAVAGITIAAAALVALSTVGASAASAAPVVAAQAQDAAAAPMNGVVHIVKNGLVKDCVEIALSNSGFQIWDEGVNAHTRLMPAPASCWNLYNEFTVKYGKTTYTGYEYQDLRGHCLWQNDGYIETAGACRRGNPSEEFFGLNYYHGQGWTVSDVTSGPNYRMAGPEFESFVAMYPKSEVAPLFLTQYWNFP
jgi:hypothetical protein